MSDEPIPELPPIKTSTQVITFTRPAIVLSQSPDGQEMNLRQGESVQVKLEIEESWGYVVVDEKPFKIVAASRRVFASLPINVLDERSEPTAAFYLANAGHRVLHGFRCSEAKHLSKLHSKPVWVTWRGFITLP